MFLIFTLFELSYFDSEDVYVWENVFRTSARMLAGETKDAWVQYGCNLNTSELEVLLLVAVTLLLVLGAGSHSSNCSTTTWRRQLLYYLWKLFYH